VREKYINLLTFTKKAFFEIISNLLLLLLLLQPGKFRVVVKSSGLAEHDVLLLGEWLPSVLWKAIPSTPRAEKKKL